MKKQLFILSLSFLMLLSCSSGDNEQSSNNELLMKTWYLVWYESESNGSIRYPVCNNNGNRDYIEFTSPNIANFYHVSSSSGNICSDEYVFEPHTFTKNGNEISLYFNGNLDKTWTITELTETTLKITNHSGFKQQYSKN